MRIGAVAGEAGVNVQTLRYYERRGLLPKPPRRLSGYREFPADAVRVVRFVKRAQDLGFTSRRGRRAPPPSQRQAARSRARPRGGRTARPADRSQDRRAAVDEEGALAPAPLLPRRLDARMSHHRSARRRGRRCAMTHRDPVCGMTIEEEDAVGTHTHEGETYYFCNPELPRALRGEPANVSRAGERAALAGASGSRLRLSDAPGGALGNAWRVPDLRHGARAAHRVPRGRDRIQS